MALLILWSVVLILGIIALRRSRATAQQGVRVAFDLARTLALRMPLAEQRVRMQAMRRLIAELNVYRWAGRMLVDASRVRRREQLLGLLSVPEAR